MTIPDFATVVEELWQLALTMASLKYIAAMVEQELNTIQTTTGQQQDLLRPEYNENDHTAGLWSQEEQPDHFQEIEDSDPSQTSEISLSMISHNIDDVTQTIENLVEPQQDIRVIQEYNPPSHLSSMTVHRLPDKDFDPGTCPLLSLCSHSIPSIHTEDFYSGLTVSTLVHKAQESSEGETETVWSMETGRRTPLEDTDILGPETHLSIVTHEITDRVEIMQMEEETISMAAHKLHSIEEHDSGTLLSMVSHLIHPPQRQQLEDINYINDINESETLNYRESDTIQKEEDNMLSSLVSHQVITEDLPHLHSMVAHSLLNTEELEIETFSTMVSHHTNKFYDDEGSIDITDTDNFKLEEIDAIEVEGSDILPVSMIQHVRTQDPSQHTSSMTEHGVITTEDQDMGILSSMISHQRFHLNDEDKSQEIADYSKTRHGEDYALKSEDDILPSLVTHQMTMSTEDESEAMLSITTHSLLDIEKQDTETLPSMLTHQVSPLESSHLSISHTETESSRYDVDDNIQEESDDMFLTSVTHELMITEDQSPYLISMTAHSLQPNEEHDAGYLTSMVTHQILPLDSHQLDDSFTDNIHKYEEDGFIQEEKDCIFPTFVTHQVPIEDSSQHLFSMKAHSLLNLEELDSGIHNSMMTHHLFVIQSDDQSIGVTEIDNPADKKTDVIVQKKDFMFPSSVTQQVNPENTSQNMISMSVHGLQTTIEHDAETVSPIIGDQLLLLARHESRDTINEIDNFEYDGNDSILEKREFMSPSSLTHQVTMKDPTCEINTMVAYNHSDMENQDTGTSLSMVTHHREIIDSQPSKDTVTETEGEENFTVLEENECMLHSCVAHKVLTEDVSDLKVSMTAHSVQTTEELDTRSLPSMVEHQTLLLNAYQPEDELTDTYIQNNKDADDILEQNEDIYPTTITHEIITEDISEHTPSMVTHSLHNTEELDVGHLHSMVTHQTLLGDCDSYSHLIIDNRLVTVNTTEEKEDEDNLTYGEMISSCANADLDGILPSDVGSVPHSAHDYSQDNTVPFQNLSKAAKRRRRRKLQKSFKRSQEILMDDMEDEESILEPSVKQYPKSMVTHLKEETETENVPCSMVAHREYPVKNEEGRIMTSTVGHQTIDWAEEMESVDNTNRETVKDVGVLETCLLKSKEGRPTEDISLETTQFLSLNDGPVSPNIIPDHEIQTNLPQSMNTPQSKDKHRKSQRVSRLQRLQRTKERLQEKEKSPSPSLFGSQEEKREWIEDRITDVDVDIEMNPGATSEQSTSPPSLPQVDIHDNYVDKSFENVMDASNKIYNEKVATKHKLTIERIEQLRKVVIEEIENCEIDKNENRTSSLEKTVVSNVKGVIFPLEISIYNSKSDEQTSLDNKDEEDNLRKNNFDHIEEVVDYSNNKHNLLQLRNTKEYREQFIEEDNSEPKLTKIKDMKLGEDISDVNDSKNKSAQLNIAEETKVSQLEDTENIEEEYCKKITSEEERKIPLSTACSSSNLSIAIKAPLENKGNDSGFEGSPDIRKQSEDENVATANELSRYHYRRQSSLTKNTEEIKIRDKELLESFLKNENHEKKEDSPIKEIIVETKATNKIPQIPLPVLKKSSEQQKESGFKRKIISTDYKDQVMKQTYKIRFKVNLRQVANTEPEKPTVIKSLLNFFKKFTVFGRK